jgi:hypothetical protein
VNRSRSGRHARTWLLRKRKKRRRTARMIAQPMKKMKMRIYRLPEPLILQQCLHVILIAWQILLNL